MSLYVSRPLSLISRLYLYIKNFTQTRHWQLKLSLVLFGFVLLTTYPNYLDILADPAPRETFSYFFDKVAAPLSPVTSVDDLTHGAKIAFRLTVPLLAKALNLGFTVTGKDIVLIFVLQSLLLIPFLLMLIRLFNRFLDPVSSVLLVVACSATYMAKAFFWDYHFWFDGYAYFFLLAGMYFKRRWLVFSTLLLACWTDERAVIALAAVYLFHRLQESDFKLASLKELLPSRSSVSRPSAVVLLVLSAYVLGRWFLNAVYGLSTPSGQNVGVSLSILPYQIKHRMVGILFTFEGLWTLFALAIIVLIKQKNKFLVALLVLGILLHIIVAYSVYDITRSLAYAFPLMLIAAIVYCKDYGRNKKQVMMLVMLTCVFIPTHYVIYYIVQIPWTIFSYEEFRFIFEHM